MGSRSRSRGAAENTERAERTDRAEAAARREHERGIQRLEEDVAVLHATARLATRARDTWNLAHRSEMEAVLVFAGAALDRQVTPSTHCLVLRPRLRRLAPPLSLDHSLSLPPALIPVA